MVERAIAIEYAPEVFMSFSDQVSEKIFMGLCSRIRTGSIQITDPNGRVHLIEGERAPQIRAEVEIQDPSAYTDLLTQGDWGLGWAYVQGKWGSKNPGQLPRIFMLNEELFRPWVRMGQLVSPAMRSVVARMNRNQETDETTRRRTLSECYDVGNDFYTWILGPSMVYSCAVWPHEDATLEEAQENKLRMICEKARIESHHRVLELGCGFGSLAGYIHRETGAHVTAITMSKNQLEWAQEHHPGCEFLYLNYANITGTYDRIVSVGMAEHVGRGNMTDFLQLVSDHLEPGGRFVMHTMLAHDDVLMETRTKRWTSFASVAMPNGDVPSMSNIVRAALTVGSMRILHSETFGIHYGRTGQAWMDNQIRHRDEIIAAYSEEFYRVYMYSWYMGMAAFETGITVGQIVFEKKPYGAPHDQISL
jgi:cyclopropane-fatty-acyl-phospholipid synthase